MSVKRDATGRRFVEAEVEVPGTPEEVWRAIATGPGISSWFVPTDVDERVGGVAKCSFGPGMDSISTITTWDPPRRFASDSQDLGPEAPTVATEWIVEAKSGGTCIVRVVHSLFTDSDDWDNELEAWEGGWPDFFRILRLYLEHFQGQPSALLPVSAMTSLEPGEAWKKFSTALGVLDIAEGEERRVDVAGLPSFEIHVEGVGQKPPHQGELLVRTGEPTPGLAHWFALKMGEQTMLSLRFYVYGDSAQEAVQRAEPLWNAWISEQFPAS
ncbi:MAG: SRPBCC domain-containing protein [Deltaproteobacteria bacterium]|nr:SRPBCC domain-containing protein [Deltaproteobacteria bacterium]